MSFINNNIMELDLFEVIETNSHTFKRSYNNIKLSCRDALLNDILSLLFCSYEFDDSTARQPFSKLILPVTQSDLWRDYDMWPFNFFELFNKRDDRNSLDSFSQTHIISQYSIDTTFIKRNHPI